ncbi:MAG: S8 family peptidase [Janthinobacterium lividum]
MASFYFRNTILLAGLALLAQPGNAQTVTSRRWQHLDLKADGVPGISADRAYRELLVGRQPAPVLVAIIDSGIDSTHEDLKGTFWKNPGERTGNGLDDDHNGYADDVRGWSFLGNKDGRNLASETLEETRLFAEYDPQFAGKKRRQLPADQQASFAVYERAKALYLKDKKTEDERYQRLSGIYRANERALQELRATLQLTRLDSAALRQLGFAQGNQTALRLAGFLRKNSFADAETMMQELSQAVARAKSRVEVCLNPAYRGRDIVGDELANLSQRDYGNSDTQGPDPMHGTHVAGIIGGIRTNQLGAEGIAPASVRIMSVRSTPNGDERDKDVANAIRYAVDNGAQIINMSFGKPFSPNRQVVEEAFRYAEQKGVLLVKAAGNSFLDIDTEPEFPSPRYLDGQAIPNLITVGASSCTTDKELAAKFSNYGKANVDVFAPGVDIYSSTPGNTYALESGTSMASPVVAGLAATLKAYFPQLTAVQLKQIILQSAVPYHTQVARPGSDKLVDFTTLSTTGGIANLYAAVQLAQQLTASKQP